MMGSTRIAHIRGVDVRVHWSWFVIFALVVWTLSASVFPEAQPGLSSGEYAAMAVTAALIFFGSLLLHELGHVAQAQRDGMQIDGITLWLIGGVAQFRGMFPNANAERRIALAGPAVSALLGLIFVGVGQITALGEEVTLVAGWLGYVNLALAVFNMLPAPPLDGGRVLHAILWQRSGDLAHATRVAGRAGGVIGSVLIGLGFALIVVLGNLGGAWLALLGWFVLTAARAEARSVLIRQALQGLRTRDLMTPDPVTVSATTCLAEFVDAVAGRSRFTGYPVLDHGAPVGLLLFRDVVSVPRERWGTYRASQQMIPVDTLGTVTSNTPATRAFEALVASPANRVLVIDGGRLTGLLSISDAIRTVEAGGMRAGHSPGPGPAASPRTGIGAHPRVHARGPMKGSGDDPSDSREAAAMTDHDDAIELRVSHLEDEVNALERQIEEMREEIRAIGRLIGEALGAPERGFSV
jgi:Zn-dependent protease